MTERLRRAGTLCWAVLGVLVLIYVLARVVLVFSVVIPPVIFAGAIVFLLNPIVTRLQRRGIPRAAAAGLTYLGVLALIALAAVLIVPLATNQADELRADWPEIQDKTERWLDERAVESEGTFWEFTREGLSDALSTDDEPLSERLKRAREIGIRVFEILLIVVLSPILAFYVLVDLPHIRKQTQDLVPEGARAEVMVVARRLNRAIGGYFRGQLAVALIVGVLCSVGLLVIGLRFWFLVGMIAGLFNIIPLIGPWVGGVPGVVIALTTGSTLQAVGVVVVMVVAQQIDNHFITPYVMQRAVHLHPAAVILALLAGGHLAGLFGLLLAVPAAAVARILISHVWRTHVLGEPLEDVEAEDDAEDALPHTGMVTDVV